MTSCQSTSAWFISSANAATSAAGTCGSAAPWQARILARTAPGRAGRLVGRPPGEPGSAVDEKDSRPRPSLTVIPAELAGQRGFEVAVRKVTGRDIHAPKIIIE